jgi:ribonuclease BN (tRNA processing enzyme)
LLPSTFDENGSSSARQHLACFVIDDRVAVDAGSLAMAASDLQREQIRDVVLTHAHLDHIAGLPMYIDDLFATTTEPVRIFATREVVEVLERDIFNWSVYPRFRELTNDHGPVMEYREFKPGCVFQAGHLRFRAVGVNHKVPSFGFIISDGSRSIALTGDTAETKEFWEAANTTPDLAALLVECAFPDELEELAMSSHHFTPRRLAAELKKCDAEVPVYVVNMKPMYRDRIVEQLGKTASRVQVIEPGRVYEW